MCAPTSCTHQSPDGQEVVTGARMRDALTKEEWDVRAKVVINATGTYCMCVCVCVCACMCCVCVHASVVCVCVCVCVQGLF